MCKRLLCWWMSKQETTQGFGAGTQLQFIITQSVFSQEKWAQVHSVLFCSVSDLNEKQRRALLRGFGRGAQLQPAPHAGQACALNAKLPHKLEMTTWFMQVIHFTVRLGDIAVIQYSSSVLQWGKWGRCSQWNYANATEAYSAPEIKHYVITAGEDNARLTRKQGVCVKVLLKGKVKAVDLGE